MEEDRILWKRMEEDGRRQMNMEEIERSLESNERAAANNGKIYLD